MAKVKEEDLNVDMSTVDENAVSEDDVAGAQFEDNEDGLVISLEGVQEQKFELLPKGKYNVIIEDNEYNPSKSSGKPTWYLKVAVTDDGEFQNRKLFPFLSFSEGALPGTKAALAVIKPGLLSGHFRINDPEIVSSLIGVRAKISVDIQKGTAEYPDPQNRVKRWFQPEGNDAFITG